MLLNGGTLNGAQVLKPETVALMAQNHIGDLDVRTLETQTRRCRMTPSSSRAWRRSGA